jgi:hypothetical protein
VMEPTFKMLYITIISNKVFALCTKLVHLVSSLSCCIRYRMSRSVRRLCDTRYNDLQWHTYHTEFVKTTHSLLIKITHVCKRKRRRTPGTELAGRTQRHGRYFSRLTKTPLPLVSFGVTCSQAVRRFWPVTNVFQLRAS